MAAGKWVFFLLVVVSGHELAAEDFLQVAWSQRCGENSRDYLLGPAIAGDAAIYLPVTTIDASAMEGGAVQNSIWRINTTTGQIASQIDLGAGVRQATSGGTISAIRGIAPLDDDALLFATTADDGSWEVGKVTVDGKVQWRKRLQESARVGLCPSPPPAKQAGRANYVNEESFCHIRHGIRSDARTSRGECSYARRFGFGHRRGGNCFMDPVLPP